MICSFCVQLSFEISKNPEKHHNQPPHSKILKKYVQRRLAVLFCPLVWTTIVPIFILQHLKTIGAILTIRNIMFFLELARKILSGYSDCQIALIDCVVNQGLLMAHSRVLLWCRCGARPILVGTSRGVYHVPKGWKGCEQVLEDQTRPHNWAGKHIPQWSWNRN